MDHFIVTFGHKQQVCCESSLDFATLAASGLLINASQFQPSDSSFRQHQILLSCEKKLGVVVPFCARKSCRWSTFGHKHWAGVGAVRCTFVHTFVKDQIDHQAISHNLRLSATLRTYSLA